MTVDLICVLLLALGSPFAQGEGTPEEPLVAEGRVPAPIGQVWDAFTTREGVLDWQIANATDIELEIGATWRTSYDAESDLDDDTVIENEILAFDPLRMLAVRTTRPPANFPFPRAILDTWTVLYLEPVGDRETLVTIRMFGFTDSEESQEMRAFFEWGNQYEIERLAEYFAGQP